MKRLHASLVSMLVVLGCTLASSAAFAGSSVTLYGLADVFAGSVKNPGAQAAASQLGGGMTTSFWGIRGHEDLGNGLSSFFVLESYFQPQNGNYGRFAGDSFFSRNAYVGLSSRYGSVFAGRITTPLYLATIRFNPFVNSYTFSPMIFQTFKGLGTQGVIGDSGWNNAISYKSPLIDGFTGQVIYALGNTAGNNSAKKWSASLGYAHGRFAAAAVYQYINFRNTPGDLGSVLAGVSGLTSQSTAQIDGSYDFRFVKVFAQYMNILNRAASGNVQSNTGQIGASVPLGPGSLLGSFAYTKSTGSGSNDDHRSTWAIGYDHPLSKHTDVYTAFKYDRFDNLSAGMTYGVGLRTSF